MEQKTKLDRIQEDVRLLYQVSGANTNALKQQQWTACYYVLIMYGAILAYASLLDHFEKNSKLAVWETAVLSALAFITAGAGIWYVRGTAKAIDGYREDVRAFADYADSRLVDAKIAREVCDVFYKPEHNKRGRDNPVRNMMFVAIAIAGVLTVHALWRPFFL